MSVGAAHQGLGVPSQGNLLDWADKALGQGISSVTRSVKNLLSGARQAPVAAALEALMDGKQVSWLESNCPLLLQVVKVAAACYTAGLGSLFDGYSVVFRVSGCIHKDHLKPFKVDSVQ